MPLRKAISSELPIIWEIIRDAIALRKQDGSLQWQNGYPNEQTIYADIAMGYGYVLIDKEAILAYAALIFGVEPAYKIIDGKWLTDGDYLVVHRVATAKASRQQGYASQLFELIEEVSIENNVYSIRVDTNFDNLPMLRIMDKLRYTYCGEVMVQGSPRKAFEKVLVNPSAMAI